MIIIDYEQYSPEWWTEKLGKPSASCFDKIVTMKGDPSKQAKNYLYQLAGERIVGGKVETYTNAAMERGLKLEPEARSLFEIVKEVEVKQVGLVYFNDEKRFSCSPDGLLQNSGLEIKCPLIHTHVSYVLGGTLPSDYFQQVQGSMLVTGFSSWWFMSYFPGLPPFIIVVQRDDKFCAALKVALDDFCEELDQVEAKLRGMV